MNSLQRLQETLRDGLVLEVVENTYRPELNGTRRTIEKTRKTTFRFRTHGDNIISTNTLPKRTSDVTWLDDDTVRYKIREDGHTVTLRIVH
jgi:hypothetical protein